MDKMKQIKGGEGTPPWACSRGRRRRWIPAVAVLLTGTTQAGEALRAQAPPSRRWRHARSLLAWGRRGREREQGRWPRLPGGLPGGKNGGGGALHDGRAREAAEARGREEE